MHLPSFWAALEEPATDFDALHSHSIQGGSMQSSGLSDSGTLTKTATREEDDQDPIQPGMQGFPRHSVMAAKTLTQAREEDDQEPTTDSLRGFPSPLSDHS